LFTDFGASDLYVPQVKLVLAQHGIDPSHIVDLLHEAPAFDVPASAHLLTALVSRLPRGTVVMAVVDPGVGGPRRAAVVRCENYWLVGPDNGLLSVTAARGAMEQAWHIVWRPQQLAATFHGRDLFAPVAAALAKNAVPAQWLTETQALDVSVAVEDLARVIYVDHYGNALTGLRAAGLPAAAQLSVAGREISQRRTFSEAPLKEVFWYENSLGLVEIAANLASAAEELELTIGTPLQCTVNV
jgi:S-adenosyl-L-methionine hydrolase (adenosine-forming)